MYRPRDIIIARIFTAISWTVKLRELYGIEGSIAGLRIAKCFGLFGPFVPTPSSWTKYAAVSGNSACLRGGKLVLESRGRRLSST